MLVATYNCNSVRARLETILAWLGRHKPDVLALQETKVTDDLFPAEAFRGAGWRVAFRGQKAYNGVAMVTRAEPEEATFGLGDDDGESGPRLALVRLGDVHVLNTYVPQGQAVEAEAFQFKLRWLARLREFLAARFDPAADKVIWVGDVNVAPTPADVYDSKQFQNHVCHCPQVIEAFQAVVDWGFVDVFRKHIPAEKNYTFWDFRLPRGVQRNLGWRIDAVLATPPAAGTSIECFVDVEARKASKPSDHTFVAARFEL